MSGQPNAEPIIVKKKKVVSGDGHHGGAWKVAYADFVTAMMAFFMMMWLLNATTEQQRRGLADYFSPTIPVSRQSGGGEGAFQGDSMFAEDVLAQNGVGATNKRPTDAQEARGDYGQIGLGSDNQLDEQFRKIEEILSGRSGESVVSDDVLSHIVTRVTDEGLVIEIFDLQDATLFIRDTDRSTRLLRDLVVEISDLLNEAGSNIAIGGHVRTNPVVQSDNPVWPLSANRADRARSLLQATGVPAARFRRVTGHADRKHSRADPLDVRNNRIELILLIE